MYDLTVKRVHYKATPPVDQGICSDSKLCNQSSEQGKSCAQRRGTLLSDFGKFCQHTASTHRTTNKTLEF